MKILTTLIVAILLSGCVNRENRNSRVDNSQEKIVSLSNSGTICLVKTNSSSLLVKYYPLSTSCASSSIYSWKLNGFDSSRVGDNIRIDSYSLYKKSNSKIATKDCAGARVIVKKIAISKKYSSIYWGKKKILESINELNSSICYKKDKDSIKKVKTL